MHLNDIINFIHTVQCEEAMRKFINDLKVQSTNKSIHCQK